MATRCHLRQVQILRGPPAKGPDNRFVADSFEADRNDALRQMPA